MSWKNKLTVIFAWAVLSLPGLVVVWTAPGDPAQAARGNALITLSCVVGVVGTGWRLSSRPVSRAASAGSTKTLAIRLITVIASAVLIAGSAFMLLAERPQDYWLVHSLSLLAFAAAMFSFAAIEVSRRSHGRPEGTGEYAAES